MLVSMFLYDLGVLNYRKADVVCAYVAYSWNGGISSIS